MARWGLRFLERQYELLSKLVCPEAILVANPGILAAALVREKAGTPLAHIILQPWMIPSVIAPPVLPYCTFLRGAPRPLWRMLWRGMDLLTDVLVKGELNRLRGKLGLKPTRRILANWLSPELVLGLFPPWYGPPQADWPKQIQLTGFPMFDGGKGNRTAGKRAQVLRSRHVPHRLYLRHGNDPTAGDVCGGSGGVCSSRATGNLPHQICRPTAATASTDGPALHVRTVPKTVPALRRCHPSRRHWKRGQGAGRRDTTIDSPPLL